MGHCSVGLAGNSRRAGLVGQVAVVGQIDPRLASALAVQLDGWRTAMRGGATHVGWKLGLGEGERIGRGPVVGHLTSATELQPGSVFRARGARALKADAEIGLELTADVAIVQVSVAPGDDVIAALGALGRVRLAVDQ
jgi:hypothetical protein